MIGRLYPCSVHPVCDPDSREFDSSDSVYDNPVFTESEMEAIMTLGVIKYNDVYLVVYKVGNEQFYYDENGNKIPYMQSNTQHYSKPDITNGG